jgi:thymidylate kinase
MLAIFEDHNDGEQDVAMPLRSVNKDHMIIELFGPPASGKSTLAKALVAALRENGISVRLNASSRPAESSTNNETSGPYTTQWSLPLAAPLKRAAKAMSLVHLLMSGEIETEVGKTLLELLPPRSLISKVRLQRYLWLLHQSQTTSASFQGVTIIDQGYVTALCSLAVRTKFVDASSLACSLKVIPRPDLLICLNTPHEILQARLAKRLGRQNALERIFEQSSSENRKQIEMVDTVVRITRENYWRVMNASWLDRDGLKTSVDKIVQAVKAQREAA